jgi:hypothetical protein
MAEALKPQARFVLYTPRDGGLDNRLGPLETALGRSGAFPLADYDRMQNLANEERVVTLIASGAAAGDVLSFASGYVTGLRRRVALVVPAIPDFRTVPRPGYADRHLSSVAKWEREIDRGTLDVVTIGPNGEVLIGAEFLRHRQSRVDDETVAAQLGNEEALKVIVDFVTKGTNVDTNSDPAETT